MYKGFLGKCGFSDYMLDYLQTAELSVRNAVEIVLYAPVSIYIKLDELKKIYESMVETAEEHEKEYCLNGIKNIEIAIRLLAEDGVFSMEESCYEGDFNTEREFIGIYASWKDVAEYVKDELEQWEPDPEERFWYHAIKWVKNKAGKYIAACEYVLVKDEILFSELQEEMEFTDIQDIVYYAPHAVDLNLPVPFKAGDILEFDGYPFGPKFRAIITEVGDNRDCCCVQALAMNKNGKWSFGAVKHGLSNRYWPMESLLYAVKPFTGELSDKEKLLLEVQQAIDGSEERGRKLWNAMYEKILEDTRDGLPEAEMRKVVERI